jgi:hypothetical protein
MFIIKFPQQILREQGKGSHEEKKGRREKSKNKQAK